MTDNKVIFGGKNATIDRCPKCRGSGKSFDSEPYCSRCQGVGAMLYVVMGGITFTVRIDDDNQERYAEQIRRAKA